MAKYHYAPLILPIVTTLPDGGAEGAMIRLHSDGRVYHRRNGAWEPDVGEPGPPGPPGVVVSETEPEQDTVLWVDPSEGPTEVVSPSDFESHIHDHSAHSSGRELAYVDSDVAQSNIGTNTVELNGLTISFEVTQRPVMVELHLPWVTLTANGTAAASICDSSLTVLRFGALFAGPGAVANVIVRERISAPGSYVRKAGLQRSAGTGTVSNNLGLEIIRSSLRVVEV